MPLVTAMFPGQGSQSVGMAKEVLHLFPGVKRVFEEASDAIGMDVSKLCLEGAASDLEATANQQPAILTTSYAYWMVLKTELGIRPSLFMGHSLGEYCALVASGKLNFATAVTLVRKRGEAMQRAVPAGEGAMAAVIGAEPQMVIDACREEPGCVEAVNFNAPNQQIISGAKAAVLSVCEKLKKNSIRCMLLPVSAPFHSSLMAKAREDMTVPLMTCGLRETKGEVIANLTGRIEQPYVINLLIKQIDSPVLWTKSLECAQDRGGEIFIEIGPGRVLSGLAKKTLKPSAQIFTSFGLEGCLKDPAMKSISN